MQLEAQLAHYKLLDIDNLGLATGVPLAKKHCIYKTTSNHFLWSANQLSMRGLEDTLRADRSEQGPTDETDDVILKYFKLTVRVGVFKTHRLDRRY